MQGMPSLTSTIQPSFFHFIIRTFSEQRDVTDIDSHGTRAINGVLFLDRIF